MKLIPKNPTVKIALSVLFAALFIVAYVYSVLFNSVSLGTVASSPFGFLALCAFGYAVWKCWGEVDRRTLVLSIIFAVLFAIASIVSSNLMYKGSTGFGSIKTYFCAILMLPLITILISRAFMCFGDVPSKGANAQGASGEARMTCKLLSFFDESTISQCIDGRRFFIIWGIIFVCSLPYLAISWPGVYNFDAIYQNQYLLTGQTVWAHHPILHTLWLSVPMQVSMDLFGSYYPGYAFYTVTQMIVVSAAYAYALSVVFKWGISRTARIVFLIFFALFPGFASWSVASTKDVLFAPLFAMCFVQLLDILVFNKDDTEHRRIRIAALWLSMLAMFMFRNNGAYGFVLFAVIAIVFFSGKRVKMAMFAVSVVAVYALITGPLYAVCGVRPGGSQEMMSIPAVQLARTINVAPDSLSSEDREFIEEYVPDWKDYINEVSDPVKFTFNADKVKEEPMQFLSGYLKIGVAHPNIYTDAFLRLTIGYWSPWLNNDDQWYMSPFGRAINTYPGEFGEGYIYLEQASPLPNAVSQMWDRVQDDNLEQRIPGIATLFQTGTWVWFLLFLCAVCIRNRRYDALVICMFIWTYWFTLLLGPASMYRYSNVLFACLPALCVLLASLHSRAEISRSPNTA